jgi:hypothetical protein
MRLFCNTVLFVALAFGCAVVVEAAPIPVPFRSLQRIGSIKVDEAISKLNGMFVEFAQYMSASRAEMGKLI